VEDVRYGPHPDQVADLTLPPAGQPGPVPLVLLLHGGFWSAQHDRRPLRPMAQALNAAGYAVANVEYRRVGDGGGWPTTLTDVALACDALPALIERAHPGKVDPDAVVLIGHSAGGHRDALVPIAMSRAYAAAFAVPLIEAPGAGHFAFIAPLRAPGLGRRGRVRLPRGRTGRPDPGAVAPLRRERRRAGEWVVGRSPTPPQGAPPWLI
jgi:alpha-beta hydrolase superfamily lysophospholipase